MLETLTALFQPWADLYAESAVLPTLVITVHVVALFAGGGVAIAADRDVLRAAPGSSEAYLAAAEDLGSTHGIVIGALVVTVLSGLALATADLGTFWGSVVFWSKMAALSVLIANGVLMRRAERQLLTHARNTVELSVAGPEVTAQWRALRTHAAVSLAGWFAVVMLGVIVANI